MRITKRNGAEYIGTAKVIDNGERKSTELERAVQSRTLGKSEDSGFDKRVDITCVSYRTRLIDPDNLCPKFFIDGLRYAGILRGDTADDIGSVTCKQVKVKTKSEEKTELIVEECD